MPRTVAETWLTVSAVLARDEAWGPAGHLVAWGQSQQESPASAALAPSSRIHKVDRAYRLGAGWFDTRDGRLLRIADIEVTGPLLDIWRAPTENDIGEPRKVEVERVWREAGLHRMRHRIDGVDADGRALVVHTRVAPAGTDLGLVTTYRWTAHGELLRLVVTLRPEGDWACPLPRLGLRMALPCALDQVEWFGRGPGETYPDSHQAGRIGRFTGTVDELQTPYVYPQENGNRSDVRWLRLTDPHGKGLQASGAPVINFTVRRWTSEDLEAARHPIDLSPRDHLVLNLDHALHGLGSASWGPEPLPAHRLRASAVTFEIRIAPIG